MNTADTEKNENVARTLSKEVDLTFNLLDVIKAVWKWRKWIIISVITVFIGAIIVSFSIPNYYTATMTIIPANEEKDLFGEGTKNNGLYGDEDAVDRTIIFANSSPIVGFMVDSFKLAKRYNISTKTPKGIDKVGKRFRKLYTVKKNEHSGIELSIEDTDPELAARMLEALKNKLANIYKGATASNKVLLLKTYELALQDKRKELLRMSDSLIFLRKKYHIYDVETQGEVLAEIVVSAEAQLSEARAKLQIFKTKGGRRDSLVNLMARVQGLEQKLNVLQTPSDSTKSSISLVSYNEGRDQILAYEEQIESLTEDMGEIQTEYAQFKAQANSKAEAIIVLEPAEVPKVKSYPRRSILVLAAAFIAFIVGVLAALILELNRRVDWEQVLKD